MFKHIVSIICLYYLSMKQVINKFEFLQVGKESGLPLVLRMHYTLFQTTSSLRRVELRDCLLRCGHSEEVTV